MDFVLVLNQVILVTVTLTVVNNSFVVSSQIGLGFIIARNLGLHMSSAKNRLSARLLIIAGMHQIMTEKSILLNAYHCTHKTTVQDMAGILLSLQGKKIKKRRQLTQNTMEDIVNRDQLFKKVSMQHVALQLTMSPLWVKGLQLRMNAVQPTLITSANCFIT